MYFTKVYQNTNVSSQNSEETMSGIAHSLSLTPAALQNTSAKSRAELSQHQEQRGGERGGLQLAKRQA